jgi:hypothetical protein
MDCFRFSPVWPKIFRLPPFSLSKNVPSLPLIKRAFKAAWRTGASLLKPKAAVLELTSTQTSESHLLQDGLDFAMRQIMEETGASGAAIAFRTGAELSCRASCGTAPPAGTFVDPDAGLTGICFRTGEALLCRDTELDSRVDASACRTLSVRSVLVVPLVKQGASCGVLELFSPLPDTFSESHVEAVAAVSKGLMGTRPRAEHSRDEYNCEEVNSRHLRPYFAHEKHSPWPKTVIVAALIVGSVIAYTGKLLAPGTMTRSTGGNLLHAPARQVSILEDDVTRTEARIRGNFSGVDLSSVRTRASAGDAKAAYDLGERYADGAGVKQDFDQAMSWFAKAAGKGEASAQWKLALGYLKGIGVRQDDVRAAAWLLRAANHGHIGAQVALSELYFDGRGVPQDYVRAYTWATIAAQTTSGGKAYLKAMAAQMTPDELREAKLRVRAWWEHRGEPLSR